MDAFLPGIDDSKSAWLLRDLCHFHFHADIPLRLVKGRGRIYLEHFSNHFGLRAGWSHARRVRVFPPCRTR